MNMKTINIVMAIFLLLFTVLISVGCLGKSNETFDTDLFHCKYNKEKTGVIILELTEKGQEQEILVIPEEIDGLPVMQLGGVTGYPNQLHYLKSEKTKKAYFPNSLVGVNTIGEILLSNATVIIMGISKEKYRDDLVYVYTRDIIKCKRFVFDYLIDKEKIKEVKMDDSKFLDLCEDANVQFIIENEIRYIDFIGDGEVYMRPEKYDPDLNISVWYLDEDYINMWDGNYELPNDVLYLYGKQ